MEIKTVHNPPSARCYKCGNPEISTVCHHCSRCMCKEHSHFEFPAQLGLWKTLASLLGFGNNEDNQFSIYDEGYKRLSTQEEILTALGIAKIINPEYEGFIVETRLAPNAGFLDRFGYNWRQLFRRIKYYWGGQVNGIDVGKGQHCEFCTHNVSRYSLLTWLGLILTLTLFGSPLGIPLLILGIWLNYTRYMKAQLSQLPPLPIFLNLQNKKYEIRVDETLSGKISLTSEGKYLNSTNPSHGTIKTNLSYGQLAYERNRAYLQKLNDLFTEAPENRKFDMGSILFGKAAWEFSNLDVWHVETENLLKIYSPEKEAAVNALIEDPNQSEARINWENSYTIVNEDSSESNDHLPIQVVVSIRPDSDKKALDLEIELYEEDKDVANKTLIEEFYLWVPNSWGNVLQVDPDGKVEVGDNHNETYKKITWKKLTFEKRTRNSFRRSFYIQFTNKIEGETHLEGKIELSLPKTLSGIEVITFFSPLGSKLFDEDAFDKETRAYIDLDMDLSGLRYQTLKSVEKKILREGVVPDSNLIAEIVTNLAGGDFYVKRITENPSRTSKEGAHKINRYWDILGRKYSGVYPVEFHLVLTGEELVQREGGIKAGQLSVEVTIQGSTANDDMTKQVENVSESLAELIIEKLDSLPSSDQFLQQTSKQPQVVNLDYIQNEEEIQVEEIIEVAADYPSQNRVMAAVVDEKESKIIALREKLALIEDRVIEGQISETLYYELKSKIESELRELEE